MPKRHYFLALACFLAMPVIMIGGAALYALLDPAMVRGRADFLLDHRVQDFVRPAVLAGSAGLIVVLWIATCAFVLRSRQLSLGWILLAAAGPFGYIVLALLDNRSATAADPYQEFIRKLKVYWRIPLEMIFFVAAWSLAFLTMEIRQELMIRVQSFTTGIPAATLVDQQNASGGMSAFGDMLQVIYLVVLVYLLWPIVFDLAHRLLRPSTTPPPPGAQNSGA